MISGIVDDTGTVYLAGLGDTAQLTVKWGNGKGQQCRASITQQSANLTESPNGIRSVSELCQQE